MLQIASYETFEDGKVIFEEGSNGDWIYVIEEGEVEISQNQDGRRIVIEVLKAGEIFGEIAYISKTPRSATATARGTATVGIVDRTFFDREFNSLSTDFQQLLTTVTLRLRRTTERLLEATKKRA